MRLTLRTLLAYLDDALPPDKAREIGQKVAESPVAQELIERIKKVTRRRSLRNPPVQGDASKLDPNTVADYIDGQLSPEEVEQVDVTCLAEDVYLAEVAACHQILTLMLSEPARVPPSARERMYRLVKGPESIPYRKPPMHDVDTEINDAREDEESKPVRWPWYAVGTLAASIGLAFSIWLAWPTDRQSAHRSASSTELALTTPTTSSPPKVPTVPTKGESPKKNDASPTTTKKGPVIAPAPKEGTPAKTPTPDPNAGTAKKPIDQTPATAPSEARRELGQMTTANSVLLQQSAEPHKGWQRVLRGDRVMSQLPLMSLPAFRNEILLNSGIHLLLWGSVPEFLGPRSFESSVTLFVPASGIDADLAVHRGRVVVSNRTANAAVVRLRFRKEIWDVSLQPKSEAIIDAGVSYAPGVRFSKDANAGDEPMLQVFLGITKGKASLKIGFNKPIDLPGYAIIGWDSKGGAVREPFFLKEPSPLWSATLPDQSVAKEMAKARDDLAQLLIKRDSGVGVLLAETLQEELPAAQVLGVYCLSAIDSLRELLDAIDDAMRHIARGAATLALRHWCAKSGENDLHLHKLLMEKKNYSEAQADLVLQLLHPYTDVDMQQPATFTALFQYMKNERLSIRELAFSHLFHADPDGARQAMFNPTAPDEEQAAAIARWRKRIPEGKLPPKPASAPK